MDTIFKGQSNKVTKGQRNNGTKSNMRENKIKEKLNTKAKSGKVTSG